MARIERKRRIEAIRLVRAVTTVRDFFSTFVHVRGLPGGLEVPVVVAKIEDVRFVLAR